MKKRAQRRENNHDENNTLACTNTYTTTPTYIPPAIDAN